METPTKDMVKVANALYAHANPAWYRDLRRLRESTGHADWTGWNTIIIELSKLLKESE